jgi:hypothetical protein
VTNGRSSGKEVAMTFLNSSRATLLNWFVKSKNIAVRVGRQLVCWGMSIYFSMESCIAFTTKSDPSGTPTA